MVNIENFLKGKRLTKVSAGYSILLCMILSMVSFVKSANLPVSLEVTSTKTESDSIKGFLDTKDGETFESDVWDRDLRRLRNTDLFYEVSGTTKVVNGKIAANITAKNKFSVIPILKFKQGGGTSLFTAGIYNVIPPIAQEFYFPEVYGRGAGYQFVVNP